MHEQDTVAISIEQEQHPPYMFLTTKKIPNLDVGSKDNALFIGTKRLKRNANIICWIDSFD